MRHLLFSALGFLAIVLVSKFLGPFWADMLVKVMILSILALSLQLLVGITGLVSLGHAAFYAIGAYTTFFSVKMGVTSALGACALAVFAASVAALAIGALCVRTSGVYFIMVTLAFTQMAYYVFHDTPAGGGSDGVYLPSSITFFDVDFRQHSAQLIAVPLALACVWTLLAAMQASKFGATLTAIRINEQRVRAVGYNPYLYKLSAFVISGSIAGLAGFLLAARDGVVNPELAAWHTSGELLLVIILGGLGSLAGAVGGAVLFVALKEILAAEAVTGSLAVHWQFTLGACIIILVAALPDGFAPALRRMIGNRA
jgi:branched-chain amino acid transport system permease protein